ncbi:ABC transporter substrate-binding protein [Streptomyces paludis]|uniref:Sugar ABC transporter substrate-binding protein n=1 Tax=Streptomyces paludis TaxID=2282738 RepID=A0A345HYL4_9ACTN|nr:sugar ABC transporter substrate-binding protein [Streptomyces paludis]AXG81788.1 sugar ABC transporter substrate-binding protein [Streptomyces paludis]
MTPTGKRRALVAGTVLGSLLLSSCVIGGDNTSAPKGSDTEVSGTITFQTWNLKNDKFTSYFNDLIAAFEKENPDTEIKWVDQPAEGYQDKLSADAAAGSLPDVVDMGPEAAYTLAQAGVLLDLGKADPAAEKKYLDKAWQAMTFDGLGGGTYGYPWYLNTGPSFFNKKLLAKCALDPGKLPTTYDELFDQAGTMAEKCPDEAMIARMPAIETFGEYGVPLMDEGGRKFTYNDPKGVELVERFRELYAKKGLDEEALNNLQTKEVEEFKAGRLAYLPGSSYTLNDLKETAPDVYKDLAIGPRISNGSPNMYIESLVVNARSKHPGLAKAFATYVTNSANQLAFAQKASVFPSSAGTLDDPYFTEDDGDPATKVRIESTAQVREAVVWWPPAFSGSADSETLREQIAQALLGKKSVKSALDASVTYSNDRLEANG